MILTGAPVRNRAWIFPAYLSALAAQDTPEPLAYHYVLNDSEDGTQTQLETFQATLPLTWEQQDFGTKGWVRGSYKMAHLAALRNRLLEYFLTTNATHLLSVDTDILVPPDLTRRLLEDDRPVVAALIYNDERSTLSYPHRYCNIMQETPAGFRHYKEYPRDALFPVDITGACYLIRRDVVEAGVRYAAHPQGEDIPFCVSAGEHGFTCWADSRIWGDHHMHAPGGGQ